MPKTDKLLIPAGVVAARFDIADVVRERRDGRDYIFEKTYHRLAARLAPISKAQAEAIPRLDPMALYADTTPLDRARRAQDGRQNVEIRVVQLLSGALASEDGQELDMQEVADLVARVLDAGEHQTAMHSEDVRATAGKPLVEKVTRAALKRLRRIHRSWRNRCSRPMTPRKMPLRSVPRASMPACITPPSVWTFRPRSSARSSRSTPYSTDFSQKVRAGDSVEFFFEGKRGAKGGLGELLATAITSRRETQKFYRFRTPDGMVDYYDERGATSRKLLLRQPVHCADARVASDFGMRRHPLHQVLRPHTGVDWACAAGTPVMAAGSGVIEEAGRKGEYGNYLRIRHANGHKTAYGHMVQFAPGAGPGVMVRQGQIIGYVGTSGITSGPHVHFEVLVENRDDGGYRHVDPMSVPVPQERQLAGKDLADFRKEQVRIARLMSRSPVATRAATPH